MPTIQGFLNNLSAATSSPSNWRLARRSIVKYGAIQNVDELAEFARIARKILPRTVMEIGTAQGGVFWLLCRISREDATLISIDLPPEQRYSGGERKQVDLSAFKNRGQTVHPVQGNSHDPATFERVKGLLSDRKIDLLFIDGDHTYDGVRQDYEMYRSLVRSGGLVAFHDIATTKFAECKVNLLWQELAANSALNPIAIVGNSRSNFSGIGIVEN